MHGGVLARKLDGAQAERGACSHTEGGIQLGVGSPKTSEENILVKRHLRVDCQSLSGVRKVIDAEGWPGAGCPNGVRKVSMQMTARGVTAQAGRGAWFPSLRKAHRVSRCSQWEMGDTQEN